MPTCAVCGKDFQSESVNSLGFCPHCGARVRERAEIPAESEAYAALGFNRTAKKHDPSFSSESLPQIPAPYAKAAQETDVPEVNSQVESSFDDSEYPSAVQARYIPGMSLSEMAATQIAFQKAESKKGKQSKKAQKQAGSQKKAKPAKPPKQKRQKRQKGEGSGSGLLKVLLGVLFGVVLLLGLAYLAKTALLPRMEYEKGVDQIKAGQYEEASAHFQEAGDYKDADLYKACADAAILLYWEGMPEQTKAAIDHIAEVSSSVDDPSKGALNLSIWLAADYYYEIGDLAKAQKGFEQLSADYSFNGHKAGAKVATCVFCGTWVIDNIESRGAVLSYDQLPDALIDYSLTIERGGTYYGGDEESELGVIGGSWRIDESYGLSGPSYQFIFDEGKADMTTVTVKDGVLTFEEQGIELNLVRLEAPAVEAEDYLVA